MPASILIDLPGYIYIYVQYMAAVAAVASESHPACALCSCAFVRFPPAAGGSSYFAAIRDTGTCFAPSGLQHVLRLECRYCKALVAPI